MLYSYGHPLYDELHGGDARQDGRGELRHELPEHAQAVYPDMEGIATIKDLEALIVPAHVAVSEDRGPPASRKCEKPDENVYLRPPASKQPASGPDGELGLTRARTAAPQRRLLPDAQAVLVHRRPAVVAQLLADAPAPPRRRALLVRFRGPPLPPGPVRDQPSEPVPRGPDGPAGLGRPSLRFQLCCCLARLDVDGPAPEGGGEDGGAHLGGQNSEEGAFGCRLVAHIDSRIF